MAKHLTVGVTGTRNGWNENQKAAAAAFVGAVRITHLLHGQCVGIDEQFARLCWGMPVGCHITAHPGRSLNGPKADEAFRSAFAGNDVVLPEEGHFARNRTIVRRCDVLLGFPDREINTPVLLSESYGGTAYTIRQVRRFNKPFYIFAPSGLIYDRTFTPVTIRDICEELTGAGLMDA